MYAVEGTSASLTARNVITTAAIKKETCVDNDIEAKIRSGHGRDQLTKGRVKPLQECGVQPLTQYSTVGATTLLVLGNKNTVIL